ncbi:MAG: efflux RND transporter periplasmic adaptor subunit [Pirellulaceae bacterium]|nr:efflux RND transporter periplasmic adaptor subunit [Pirellulaceae bacterium]
MSDLTKLNTSKTRLSGLWFTFRMIEVRLRFVAVLVGLGLIIGYWETIQNYWDRWTRPGVASAGNVDKGTEFYCPMDPGVIREGLEPNGSIPKCGICGMPLSLRKKGTPMQLPPGVVGRVSLSPNRVRMAGIRTSEIGLRPMMQTIRTVGNVMHDESRQSQIVSRINGYIEKLYVDKTYTEVQKGDPLAEIYSPELYSAVQELKIANGIPGSSLGKMARDKIRLLGIEDREIDSMLQDGSSQYRVVVRSPASGHVIKKMVQQGATVSAGQMLFEIADLHILWIEADVYERDLGMLREGQAIQATAEAYPESAFKGRVSLIYPELSMATRTNRVRFEIDNEDHRLRAGMYATVLLERPMQETEPFQSRLAELQREPSDPAMAISQQSVCPVTGSPLGSMGKPVSFQAAGQTVYLCCAGCEKAMAKDSEHYLSRIRTVSATGVLSVPESAVVDTGKQQIVYVEREEGVYEGLEVKLGPKSNGYYAVISGLLPGDQVAAAGAFLIDAETRLNPAASASYFGASNKSATASANGSTSHSDHTMTSDSKPPTMNATDASLKNDNAAINFATSRLTAEELAEIGKLSPEDQQLAKLQVLCPVTMEPLGSMGTPIKVVVNGETVLACCEGCAKRVEKNVDAMLKMIKNWKVANSHP